MSDYIDPEYELYEVINQFPILKETFRNMQFRVKEVLEGETVYEFFEKQPMNSDEIDLMIKKLNRDLNRYMRKNIEPMTPTPSIIKMNEEEE